MTENKFKLIIGSTGDNERQKEDYYATDPIAAKWLMQIENLSNNIWECACGDGHLAKVFADCGYNVKATDLIQRSYGCGGVDFLKQTDVFDGDIVTNPPFRHAEDFIKHGLELLPEGKLLCLFLKVQFLEGQKRKMLFAQHPPKKVWVSSSRIQCSRNGDFEHFNASTIAYAWYVWEKGYVGDTTIGWFN